MKMTITEALAEIKLEQNKIRKKMMFVLDHLVRPKDRIDPLEKEGGSPGVIEKEMQAIKDLQARVLKIRTAINAANTKTVLEVKDMSMTISEWLIWKRDILPYMEDLYATMSNKINKQRGQLGMPSRLQAAQQVTGEDLISHVNEVELMEKIEELGEIKDRLDGLLSLKNAQVEITV